MKLKAITEKVLEKSRKKFGTNKQYLLLMYSGVVELDQASPKLLLLPSPPARSPRMTKQRAKQRIRRKLTEKKRIALKS